MVNKIGLLALSLLLLLIIPIHANSADSVAIDGELRISGLGSVIFSDGSVQNIATVQGLKGDTGPMGAPGPPGIEGTTYASLNYYALGDSITFGAVTTSGRFSYVDILYEKFNFNSFTKLAVDGATAFPYPGVSELATQVNAIGTDADIITIMIGVNDYRSGSPLGDTSAVLKKPYASLDRTLSFAEAFRYCLETIKRNHEQARIYVILPIQTTKTGPISFDQFRTTEVKIANNLSIPVIYAHTEGGLWSGGALMPGGLHPDITGYAVLGNYIARKIIGL